MSGVIHGICSLTVFLKYPYLCHVKTEHFTFQKLHPMLVFEVYDLIIWFWKGMYCMYKGPNRICVQNSNLVFYLTQDNYTHLIHMPNKSCLLFSET